MRQKDISFFAWIYDNDRFKTLLVSGTLDPYFQGHSPVCRISLNH